MSRCIPVPHIALALSLAVTLLAAAPVAALDARQVMEEAQRRAQADSQHYEGLLQVVDSKGKVSDKRWVYDCLGSHGRSRSLLTFVQPAEVKGVALLVVNFPDRASDQWMWTPAIERERRIALQDRSTRFFGTDFSFEDLEERDTEQYDYRMLGDESIDGVPSWKMSRVRGKGSPPSPPPIVWVRKATTRSSESRTTSKTQSSAGSSNRGLRTCRPGPRGSSRWPTSSATAARFSPSRSSRTTSR